MGSVNRELFDQQHEFAKYGFIGYARMVRVSGM